LIFSKQATKQTAFVVWEKALFKEKPRSALRAGAARLDQKKRHGAKSISAPFTA